MNGGAITGSASGVATSHWQKRSALVRLLDQARATGLIPKRL